MWPEPGLLLRPAAELDTGIMISNNQYPTPAPTAFIRTVAELRPATPSLGSDRGKLRTWEEEDGGLFYLDTLSITHDTTPKIFNVSHW